MTKTQNAITKRAMLVSLNIQCWTGAKHDKKVSKEVADKHQSDVSMGRYQKRLVGKESLDKIRAIISESRHKHYELTLPWQDGGARILSSTGYFKYAETMREFEARWQPVIDEFIREYPQMVADAKKRLNGLFNEADYPSVQKMRRKFSFAFNVLPMPTAQDFRVELGDEETARVRKEIEQSVNESIQTAMGDVWQRIHDVVAHLKERLEAYSVDSKGVVTHPFRDSLVTNIRELIDLLPSLNVTQDPAITAYATRLKEDLCNHEADELRNDDAARQRTAAHAATILKEMEAFI